MEDAKIVDLFLERNEKAIDFLSEKYGKSLKSIAYGITGNEQTSSECENDAYLDVWNSIPPHEPKEYLFAFAAKIVRAKAINRVKAETAEKRCANVRALTSELEESIPDKADVEKEIEEKELRKTIERFLKELPKEKRIIFLRRYWFSDPVETIAKRLDVSVSKVKSSLFRTRKELKDFLKTEGINQ